MPPKPKASKAASPQGSSKNTAEKPRWPPLKPLVPTCDLSLDVLLQDQVILVHKLFTNTLCQRYVSFLSSLPLVTTPGKPKKGEALRVNDRYQVEDAAFAEQLWNAGLRDLITGNDSNDWGGKPVGLNPNIRIYRYAKGQFFDQHYDESNLIVLPSTSAMPPRPARTSWTLLLYLTSCNGGETVFYPEHGQVRDFSKGSTASIEPIAVTPEIGLGLLHKHGDDCLLHEGREIIEGEKWVIRSDLCVER